MAPASADVIAKAANGIADNLLLCVLRAWDHSKPCVLCPAMNTHMLDHPTMAAHMTALRTYGWTFVESEVKLLACGEAGQGALAPVKTIVTTVRGIVDDMSSALLCHPAKRKEEKATAAAQIERIIATHRADSGGGRTDSDRLGNMNQVMFMSGLFVGAVCGLFLAGRYFKR